MNKNELKKCDYLVICHCRFLLNENFLFILNSDKINITNQCRSDECTHQARFVILLGKYYLAISLYSILW
jgi:hypothetical protein